MVAESTASFLQGWGLLGGWLLLSHLMVWRGGRARQQRGDWLLRHIREPAAAQGLGGRAELLIDPTEASGKMQDYVGFKRSA